jgi:hypothetical protein
MTRGGPPEKGRLSPSVLVPNLHQLATTRQVEDVANRGV